MIIFTQQIRYIMILIVVLELIAIGNKNEALIALQSVITNKKFRVWQQVYEPIMLKYIELCVDLRKGKFAKDGLHQYRATTQQISANSLEVVVKKFLESAEAKAKEAQSKADKVIVHSASLLRSFSISRIWKRKRAPRVPCLLLSVVKILKIALIERSLPHG